MKSKINIKKSAKVFISIVLGWMLILSAGAGVAYLDYNHLTNAHLGFLNNSAAQIGFSVQGAIEDGMDFPRDKTIIITGKCKDASNMTAFANEYLKADTVILDLHSKADKGRYYWAVKLVDGKVSEAWFCQKEINEAELRSYNDQERRDQMKLLIPLFSPGKFFKYGYIDDSEVYGYHRFNDNKLK